MSAYLFKIYLALALLFLQDVRTMKNIKILYLNSVNNDKIVDILDIIVVGEAIHQISLFFVYFFQFQ